MLAMQQRADEARVVVCAPATTEFASLHFACCWCLCWRCCWLLLQLLQVAVDWTRMISLPPAAAASRRKETRGDCGGREASTRDTVRPSRHWTRTNPGAVSRCVPTVRSAARAEAASESGGRVRQRATPVQQAERAVQQELAARVVMSIRVPVVVLPR